MLRVGSAAALVAVLTIGGTTLLRMNSGRGVVSPAAARPSLAVLPFENATGDAAQKYFSEGITDDILIALGRSPLLTVIGRNTSFAALEPGETPAEVGRRLGVKFVLAGRAQHADQRVRVSAVLVGIETGSIIWSDKYDRPLTDVFAVQDDIAGAIAARLLSRVEAATVSGTMGRQPADFSAYEDVLRAREIRYSDAGKEATLRARRLLEEAVRIDPGFALAHAELAYTYYRELSRRWAPENAAVSLATGTAAAERALSLDPGLAFANVTFGNLRLIARDYAQAEKFARRATELNPNDPEAHAGLANVLLSINRGEEALASINRAIQLDPLYPPLFDNYRGRALLLTRRFDEAISVLSDCTRRLPDSWPCNLYLAVAYHYAGQAQAARDAMQRAMRIAPFKSLDEYKGTTTLQPGPETDIIIRALHDLGLPQQGDSKGNP